jgi:hypothetical protein
VAKHGNAPGWETRGAKDRLESTPRLPQSAAAAERSWLCRKCEQRYPQKGAALCVFCQLGADLRRIQVDFEATAAKLEPLPACSTSIAEKRARVLAAIEAHARRAGAK